eukprot:3221281-Alexandrium_andersonii.AAC.1
MVLRNIAAAALAAASKAPYADSDGRISVDLIRGGDTAMAAAASHGLVWEVLSYRMEIEEPDAAECIQAACNQ